MMNTLGRPTTTADTLLSRVATLASMRVNDAKCPTANGFYDLVAFDPHTLHIWVKRDGHAACDVDWQTLRCTCPDAVKTLSKLEKECHEAGHDIVGLMCKHVHHICECIARELTDKGDDIANYGDFLEALPVAYPDLPTSWNEEEAVAAPVLDLPAAPRVPLAKQRLADYDPFPARDTRKEAGYVAA